MIWSELERIGQGVETVRLAESDRFILGPKLSDRSRPHGGRQGTGNRPHPHGGRLGQRNRPHPTATDRDLGDRQHSHSG